MNKYLLKIMWAPYLFLVIVSLGLWYVGVKYDEENFQLKTQAVKLGYMLYTNGVYQWVVK
jgi:hypothetical protein